jgi:hypothetical protein
MQDSLPAGWLAFAGRELNPLDCYERFPSCYISFPFPGFILTLRGWKRAFDEPIPLPNGRELVTLKDAGTYITKLPKAEHEAPEWQAAMEALILVATRGGPTVLARIGVMHALTRHHVREFNSDRKPHHWGKRKLKRDL